MAAINADTLHQWVIVPMRGRVTLNTETEQWSVHIERVLQARDPQAHAIVEILTQGGGVNVFLSFPQSSFAQMQTSWNEGVAGQTASDAHATSKVKERPVHLQWMIPRDAAGQFNEYAQLCARFGADTEARQSGLEMCFFDWRHFDSSEEPSEPKADIGLLVTVRSS